MASSHLRPRNWPIHYSSIIYHYDQLGARRSSQSSLRVRAHGCSLMRDWPVVAALLEAFNGGGRPESIPNQSLEADRRQKTVRQLYCTTELGAKQRQAASRKAFPRIRSQNLTARKLHGKQLAFALLYVGCLFPMHYQALGRRLRCSHPAALGLLIGNPPALAEARWFCLTMKCGCAEDLSTTSRRALSPLSGGVRKATDSPSTTHL